MGVMSDSVSAGALRPRPTARSLGAAIVELRDGASQREIAHRIGMLRTQLSAVEQAECSTSRLSTVVRIATALRVLPSELVAMAESQAAPAQRDFHDCDPVAYWRAVAIELHARRAGPSVSAATQAAVAQRAGISTNHYCRIEGNRDPKRRIMDAGLDLLVRISVDGLDLTTSRLLNAAEVHVLGVARCSKSFDLVDEGEPRRCS